MNPLDHYVWENIWGQLQVSFETELKETLQNDSLTQRTIDRAVKEFLKRLNACVVAKGGHLYYSH